MVTRETIKGFSWTESQLPTHRDKEEARPCNFHSPMLTIRKDAVGSCSEHLGHYYREYAAEEDRLRRKNEREKNTKKAKEISGIEGGQISRVQSPTFCRMTFKLFPLTIVLQTIYDLCSEKTNCSRMIYLFCHFLQSLMDIQLRHTSMAAISALWKIL